MKTGTKDGTVPRAYKSKGPHMRRRVQEEPEIPAPDISFVPRPAPPEDLPSFGDGPSKQPVAAPSEEDQADKAYFAPSVPTEDLPSFGDGPSKQPVAAPSEEGSASDLDPDPRPVSVPTAGPPKATPQPTLAWVPVVEGPPTAHGRHTHTPTKQPTNAPVADPTKAPVADPTKAPVADTGNDPEPDPDPAPDNECAGFKHIRHCQSHKGCQFVNNVCISEATRRYRY